MIERNKYLQTLIKNKDNGFPKVITGIRRCGKSFLLSEIYKNYLLKSGISNDHVLIIDLDIDKNSSLRDPLVLGAYVRSHCQNDGRYYVILDEIQRVYSIVNPNLTDGKHIIAKKSDKEVITFVDVVLGLSSETNIDLYVTGSNSKMLSSDIVTQFRDKATNIHIGPLSFEEFSNYDHGSKYDSLYEYMQYGGMPLAVLKDGDSKKDYLKNIFETTYFKDIIDHNDLKKTDSLYELCNIISVSIGGLINSEKISNTFKTVRHEEINKQTIERYIGFFKDAFIINEARRYDIKGRAEIGALKKYYFVDLGLRNARLNFAFPDEGQTLENIVYNELLYNDYSVNIGSFDTIEKDKTGKSVRKNNEIDFIATKNQRRYYIQVCADIGNAETKKRETRPFALAKDQAQKVIVINKPINECKDEDGITIIGITDFLLRFIK